MKHLALSCLAFCLPYAAGPAHANDIMDILAAKANAPARLAPTTIEYTYTLTLDLKEREGKALSEGQAVLRIDPTQPPGSRTDIISASDIENEALKNFIEEIEDKDNTMKKQASGFWCGPSNPEARSEFNPETLTIISQDETQAVLRPDATKLAALLMQSDENAEKNGKTMMKKLLKRIEGDITLSKPSGEMTGFTVRMTRPMTMMIVAKLNEMDVVQSCELAPNGHYRLSRLEMNVAGKAMGSRFGQEIDMRVSDLTPLR